MLSVSRCIPGGKGLAYALIHRSPGVTLDWDMRQKSRFAVQDDAGRQLAVVLPRGQVLRGGDILVAEDGSLIAVHAAAQRVLRVTASDMHGLLRAAYHLGNRHIPVEVGRDYLQLEDDPVLHDMLQRIGARVNVTEAPFEPEAGAYGGGHRHGHDASFAEDQALAQAVFALHAHDRSHSHASHGHGHDPAQPCNSHAATPHSHD